MSEAECCVASHHLRLGQKVALAHTANTTSEDQLACLFCVYIRNTSPDQQVEIACFRLTPHIDGFC